MDGVEVLGRDPGRGASSDHLLRSKPTTPR
jgi:hypothetical protein